MKLNYKIGYKDIMSRFINQGSYGCIYSPAFPCEMPEVNPSNRISKIFKTKPLEHDFYKTYNEEKAIYDNISPHLRSIDPHEEYFIYKYHQCKFKKSPYINDIIASCKDANRNRVFKSPEDRDYHWALNFSKGGRDLHNIIESLPQDRIQPYIALLKQLEHVIEGIHKLNKKGIYHLDIKPGNIVIHNNVLKIIDFGLCKKLIPTNRFHEIFRSAYEYWPIEALWLSSPELTPNMIDTHIRNYANKAYIRRLKSTFPDANITLSQMPLDRIYNNIDVWSFGMILYEVYKKMPDSMNILKRNLSGMINRLISGPRQKSDDALKMYKLYIQHIIIPPSVWMSV